MYFRTFKTHGVVVFVAFLALESNWVEKVLVIALLTIIICALYAVRVKHMHVKSITRFSYIA